ncbi:MAG: 30S ribosomal protein S4 [Elusimicrobia bacterium CG_4_10_14_0_2_um_filter_56_8]|nr:MAG: 30S ribosomal protein S4 [Elusimicrobia bacterium CG1_02_56_21]PJA11835.1 MAG: 30S ribosomal protein S4 [Elusimicrobia bacterium CG_4_10_14_0_2_um_filter_56_8]
MSRYTGPSCKKCVKVSQKMFLKGTKCHTNCLVDRAQKAEKDKRFSAGKRPNKMSDYGKHLREKQIARLSAQVTETQFKRFFTKASKQKGQTGAALLRFLEVRLDNVVRRLGFAVSLKAARQLVNHGHIKVNGRCLDIASAMLKPGDEVTIDTKTAETLLVKQGLEHAEKTTQRPSFLSWDAGSKKGKLVRWPDRAESSISVDEQLIVEYYSK